MAVLACCSSSVLAATPVATVQSALGAGTGVYLDGGSDGNTNGAVGSTWSTATPNTWVHNNGPAFGEDASGSGITVDGDVLDANDFENVESKDATEITVAVTGLAASTQYDVWVVHVGQTSATPVYQTFKWGQTSGALTAFDQATATSTTIVTSGTDVLTGIKVGTVMADGTGAMTFYIDDTGDDGRRSLVDGVLLEVVGAVSDSDFDGLEDLWEDQYFGDNDGTVEPSDLTPQTGSGDPDGDFLINTDEQTAGTNPNIADTDGDSLSDFEEVYVHLTNPLLADMDGDGINDGEEVNIGADGYITDPNSNDTDSDTLLDKWEIDYGLDPTDYDGDNGDLGDPDSDGLDNATEQAIGTAPQDADTDDDGLNDGDEVNTHSTDPLVADSDGDGLSDGNEVNLYATNPVDSDSDDDTFQDGLEVAEGTDPNSAASTPAGFIGVTNSVAGATAANLASDGSGLLMTTASFDMTGGNAVVFVVTAKGIGNQSALPTARFAGQTMTAVHAQDTGTHAQTASIFYLINPTTTAGVFEVFIDPSKTGVNLAYSMLALNNVPAVASTDSVGSAVTALTTPLDVNYSTATNDGIVIGAAVNNGYMNGATPVGTISLAYGNPDTELTPFVVSGSGGGHLHTYGRTGLLGDHTDGYLGQYQRTAIATVAFGVESFPDSDGDGLDDFFEDQYFGDNSGTVEPSDLTPQGGTGDPDADGLPNTGEQSAGTNPNLADTDGDNLNDYAEIYTHLTSPLLADTDLDGINDDEEVTTGADGFITNPNSNDTDSDTLLDKWEIDNGIDPTVGTGDDGATGDPDFDSLDNAGEQTAGTDPLVADVDGDNLNDGGEIAAGTDPFVADTDGDGILDGEEVVAGTDGFVTNPLSADTDGDSYTDLVEVNAGSDPTLVGSVPAGFINTVNNLAPVTVNNIAATVGADGILFTSASFDMGVGANAVALMVTTEGAGTSTVRSATFAGQPMEVVQGAQGAQSAAIYYLIDPVITSGTFELVLDANFAGTVDYAYSAVSLANVPTVVGTDSVNTTATSTTAPVELSYSTGTDDGYVLGAAVNNDFLTASNPTYPISVTGNPDTDLLSHTVVDSSGHFHTSGRVGPAGDYTDTYMGQVQRNVFVTVAFGRPADDLDIDGLVDLWEDQYFGDNSGTVEPSDLTPQNASGNPDGDGFTNLEEQTAGTNPTLADTDGDGLNDDVEVNTSNTNPLVADTDSDGLTDGAEVNVHGSNPLDRDSDDDTYADGTEVNAGTNPNNAGSFPAGFIQVVASSTPVTVDNTTNTVGPDGVLFTSAPFDMGAGNAVALMITTEGAGDSSVRSATFAGQAMEKVDVEDNGAGDQTATIFYLVDPVIPAGTFQLVLDADYAQPVDYAYTAVSLSNVGSVADTATARSTSTATTTPLVVSYTSDTDDCYVLGAAVNNDFDGTRPLSIAPGGNPTSDLLSHTVIGANNGHFHTSGRVGPAGDHADGYLGQYQRTAIASVVFSGATVGGGGFSDWSSTNAGGQSPSEDHDLDGVPNGAEYFMGATGSSFTANPAAVAGTITWPKDPAFSGTYRVETSSNLVNWTDVTGSAVDSGTSVAYTLPTGAGKLFVRLVVIPN